MFKVKVINVESNRTDHHDNLTKDDIEWIKCNPNLRVEILEVNVGRKKDQGRNG